MKAADFVVTIVRDLAQTALTSGAAAEPDTAATIADAEHALLSGDPSLALQMLATIIGVEV